MLDGREFEILLADFQHGDFTGVRLSASLVVSINVVITERNVIATEMRK